jgi:hypothetical protein
MFETQDIAPVLSDDGIEQGALEAWSGWEPKFASKSGSNRVQKDSRQEEKENAKKI